MKKLSLVIASVLATVVTAVAPIGASAATAPPANSPKLGQALEIAPPVITLTANPGQAIKTTIYLRNIASGKLIVTGQANDFVAAGEDGTPKLLLDNQNSPYSLKDWVGPLPTLQMVPKEIKTMAVSINVPSNASPGGHYGVIRFTATPADLHTTGVSLSASLGALILLTVNGQVHEQLSVQQFSVSHGGKQGTLFESGPLSFVERLKNTGNVHVAPVGQVTITNMFGKKVAAVNVNLPPHNILPQSIRKFDQPLDNTVLGSKKLFGRYTAKMSVTYGNSKKVLTASLAFWVIPYKLIAVLAVVLVAGFFILRVFIRRYNRRIIEKAQRNNQGPRDPHNPHSQQ